MKREFATLGEEGLPVREADENFDCYPDKKGILHRTRKKSKAEVDRQLAATKAEDEKLRREIYRR